MSHSAIPSTTVNNPVDNSTEVAANTLFPGTTGTPVPAPVNPVVAEAKQLLAPAGRLWLYGICVAALPLLVAYGKLSGDAVSLWTDFAASVLGVSGLTVAIANVKR